jgi:rhamnosyl/mannosyltransferase
LNILHIYKDYPPILGGIENHVRVLGEGQAARGHRVTVLVTNPAGRRTRTSTDDGVNVIRAGRLATVASTPLSLALPWQLARQRPDVVHLHFPYPVGEVSQWLLRRGQRTIMTYHSDVVRQASILKFYRPLMQRVLRSTDAIIVGSPPMRRSAFLADLQDKVHFVPYGIPLARFSAAPGDADLRRVCAHYLGAPARYLSGQAQYLDGQAQDPSQETPRSPLPVLLFVGRLRYYKGLDSIIRALSQIEARLIVAGSGPMLDEWRSLAETTGVAERIAWLGEVPDADLPALYHLADLFVLPASHPSEAFGLVQVEAMAAGLPVVCTELGTGTSYVNQDGVTGFVVPPRSPEALAGAVNRLLADPALRERMGEAAQARATAEFAMEVMVERVLALYAA